MSVRLPEAAPDGELARDLGLSRAGAIVVGTIIGSGIFLVPAEMMQAVGSAWLVYASWLLGGVLSFFGALTYAELGAMKPQAGAEYVIWSATIYVGPEMCATNAPDADGNRKVL